MPVIALLLSGVPLNSDRCDPILLRGNQNGGWCQRSQKRQRLVRGPAGTASCPVILESVERNGSPTRVVRCLWFPERESGANAAIFNAR